MGKGKEVGPLGRERKDEARLLGAAKKSTEISTAASLRY